MTRTVILFTALFLLLAPPRAMGTNEMLADARRANIQGIGSLYCARVAVVYNVPTPVASGWFDFQSFTNFNAYDAVQCATPVTGDNDAPLFILPVYYPSTFDGTLTARIHWDTEHTSARHVQWAVAARAFPDGASADDITWPSMIHVGSTASAAGARTITSQFSLIVRNVETGGNCTTTNCDGSLGRIAIGFGSETDPSFTLSAPIRFVGLEIVSW